MTVFNRVISVGDLSSPQLDYPVYDACASTYTCYYVYVENLMTESVVAARILAT